MIRRYLVALLSVFVCTSLLLSGLPAHATAQPLALTTISIWHSWNSAEVTSLQQVITAFHVAHPEVQVNLKFYPFENLKDTYATAVGSGGGPTLLIGPSDWGPLFYDAGLVSDVSTLADPPLLSTILPPALAPLYYQGALIGLPQSTKGVVLYRNNAIIASAQPTYAALVAAAQAATSGDILGANLERGFFFSAGHLEGVGGHLMDKYGCPAFNTAEGVEWLNLIDSFTTAGPADYYTDEDLALFAQGKVGFIIDGTWNLTYLRDSIGSDKLVIDPWPTPLSGYVQVENIYLNPNPSGDVRSAGWDFMEFLLSKNAQEIMSSAGHIPVIYGVSISDPHLQQAWQVFQTGVAFPVIPQMSVYWSPMDTALPSVFAGSDNPGPALRQAKYSILIALRDMGYYCSDLKLSYLPLTIRKP
jgi:arabinogalactan oligomer / maltooligosaccharide transport system substrate-binding protein